MAFSAKARAAASAKRKLLAALGGKMPKGLGSANFSGAMDALGESPRQYHTASNSETGYDPGETLESVLGAEPKRKK